MSAIAGNLFFGMFFTFWHVPYLLLPIQLADLSVLLGTYTLPGPAVSTAVLGRGGHLNGHNWPLVGTAFTTWYAFWYAFNSYAEADPSRTLGTV